MIEPYPENIVRTDTDGGDVVERPEAFEEVERREREVFDEMPKPRPRVLLRAKPMPYRRVAK